MYCHPKLVEFRKILNGYTKAYKMKFQEISVDENSMRFRVTMKKRDGGVVYENDVDSRVLVTDFETLNAHDIFITDATNIDDFCFRYVQIVLIDFSYKKILGLLSSFDDLEISHLARISSEDEFLEALKSLARDVGFDKIEDAKNLMDIANDDLSKAKLYLRYIVGFMRENYWQMIDKDATDTKVLVETFLLAFVYLSRILGEEVLDRFKMNLYWRFLHLREGFEVIKKY